MKIKRLSLFLLCWLTIISLCSCTNANHDISDKVIRFHVIANSDSAEDQSVKLKVRDAVLNRIGPELEKCNSKDECENVIRGNLENIRNTALKELERNGKSDNVAVSLNVGGFPVKSYGNITLPAGDYEALKVVIGNGQGKNWWCVMFPPLCFIDITGGVTSEDTEERLKSVLNKNEYNSILKKSQSDRKVDAVKKPIESDKDNETSVEKKNNNRIEMRFKSIEIFKSFMLRFESIFNSK